MPVVVVRRLFVPIWDCFCFATTVAVGAFGRNGATQDLSQRGVGRIVWESVMAVDRFCRNVVGPPEWECEAMVFVVWVQCTNLYRVYIKSIDCRAHG